MCSGNTGWRFVGCVLDLYLLPTVCVVGLVLNCLCLAVFKTRRHHPLVPALMVLSCCDLIQLFLSLFVLFIPALHDYTQAPPMGALGQLAYISTGLLSPLLLASNCASIWTMCYITIQRHRAILKPLVQIQSPPRPFAPLFIIIVAALFFNAGKWAEFDWVFLGKDEIVNETLRKDALPFFLFHQPSALANDEFYRKMFDLVLYPVLVYIIPLLLLTVLNLRILSNISITRVSFDHKTRLAQERRSVTLLISIVILFFFCHTGGLIYRWLGLRIYDNEDNDCLVVIKDAINCLFNFNSACNPLLYFLFTRQFRDLRSTFLMRNFVGSANRTAESSSITTAKISRVDGSSSFHKISYSELLYNKISRADSPLIRKSSRTSESQYSAILTAKSPRLDTPEQRLFEANNLRLLSIKPTKLRYIQMELRQTI